MSVTLDSVGELVRAGRLYEAANQLQSVYAANPRVWGLERQLAALRERLSQIEQLVAEGDKHRAGGDITAARAKYKAAAALVADHPELPALLRDTKQTVEEARAKIKQALACREKDALLEAWELVRGALALDNGLPGAADLHRQLSQEVAAIESHRTERRKRSMLAISLGGIVVAALAGGVIWAVYALRQNDAMRDDVQHAQALTDEATALISKEQFAEAQRNLGNARRLLARWPGTDGDLVQRIQSVLASEPLQQGLAGRVPLDGKWITPVERRAVLDRRQKLRTEMESFIAFANEYLAGKLAGIAGPQDAGQRVAVESVITSVRAAVARVDAKEVEAVAAFEQAMLEGDKVFTSQGLRKYKGRWMTVAAAEDQEKLDSGLVKYAGEWVTLQVKEEKEMTARGLVRHGNDWVTPEERETREMTAKGLVKHQGRWVTAQVKEEMEMTAKGFVKHGGQWVTREELARLEEEARLARLRAEREKVRKALPSYAGFVREVKKVDTRFGHGLSYIEYRTKLGDLLDAYAEIEDANSTLRQKADRVVRVCKLVQSGWELQVKGYGSGDTVSSSMSLASSAIQQFLQEYDRLNAGP